MPNRNRKKNFAQAEGSKAARQINALSRPELQEPQRSDNIRKMAAVYDSAVYQRVTEQLQLETPSLVQ